MRTLVVVAGTRDRLANQLCKLSPRYVRCTASALMSGSEFGLCMNGTSVDGALAIGGTHLRFDDISGILFRPTATWQGGLAGDSKVRAFVRHESQAAWCAVINLVRCPVWNRLDPAWWINPASYATTLVSTLATALEVNVATTPLFDHGESLSDRRRTEHSVYLVGRETLSATSPGQRLAQLVRVRGAAIRRWQGAHGVHLARIDFAAGRRLALARVEPVPSMATAARPFLESASALVARSLR